MKIKISENFGTRCIIASEGQKLHDMIFQKLKDGEDVCLDFTGIKQFASPFFNFSIGQLLNKVSEQTLRKSLHLEGLNDTGKLVVERVIENASAYHGNKDYKKIVDDILEEQSKGAE